MNARPTPLWLQTPACALAAPERLQLARCQQGLQAALATRERAALRAAQQEVLRSAFGPTAGASPALRQALRLLVWQMSALRPQKSSQKWL